MKWLEIVDDDEIFLSAVSLGELQAGIERTRRQNETKAREIETWLNQLEGTHQILPMDGRAFREWAKLMEGKPGELLEDAMIAATARVHRLSVVTRNTRDFLGFGVPLIGPFGTRKPSSQVTARGTARCSARHLATSDVHGKRVHNGEIPIG